MGFRPVIVLVSVMVMGMRRARRGLQCRAGRKRAFRSYDRGGEIGDRNQKRE
jgi:hypothetical protein